MSIKQFKNNHPGIEFEKVIAWPLKEAIKDCKAIWFEAQEPGPFLMEIRNGNFSTRFYDVPPIEEFRPVQKISTIWGSRVDYTNLEIKRAEYNAYRAKHLALVAKGVKTIMKANFPKGGGK